MGLILRTTHDNMPDGAIVANGRLTVEQMDNNFIFLQSISGGSPGGIGATGPDGEQGPIGATGPDGQQGPMGATGANGMDGLEGPIGATGPDGEQGPMGATGPDGFQGAPGINGLSSLSLVTLTVASASQYMDEGWITVGQPYLITDADLYLYGVGSQFGFGDGTSILLYGVDENSFTSLGYGKFYNPIYDNIYGVWDESLTYQIDDKVIYGGRVWNLTGTASIGSADYWNLQSDWEVIDYTDTEFYNVVWDEVEYNITGNYITSRYDAVYNNKVSDSYGTFYFNCETHPIQAFRWGHGAVRNCTVENSYFGCLNFVSGTITDVKLENGSIIYDIHLYNNAYLETITLSNYSELSQFGIDGGYLSKITITNGSHLRYFELSSSYCYLENITINNNSSIEEFSLSEEDNNYCYFSGISLDNDSSINYIGLISNNNSWSFFEDIIITNDSYINYITASASSFTNINISNDSQLAGITITDSYMAQMELSNSAYFIGDIETDDSNMSWGNGMDGDGTITITNNSYLEHIKITNNSLFTGPITITDGSQIRNLYMENSYIGGREQDNDNLFSVSIVNSTIDNLVLEGHSYIANLEILGSTLKNTKLSNYSKITSDGNPVYIEDSQLDLISLSNHSYIGYDKVEIIAGTNWYDVKLDNYSKIGGYIYFNSSRFGIISLNNNSRIWGDNDDIYINDSDVHYISLDNHSEISGYLNIQSSYFQNINLKDSSYLGGYNYNFEIIDSTLQYVNLSNGSWFKSDDDYINIKNSSTVEYINLTNGSYIDGYLEVGEYGNNCYLGYLDLTNDSYFGYGVNLRSGASLQQVKLENNSRLVGYSEDSDIYVYQNSIMRNIEITNDSFLSGYMNIGEGSILQNVKIDNNSHLSAGIYVYGWDNGYWNEGSTFENITITNGSSIIGDITVGNYDGNSGGHGYLGNVTVTNGSLLGDNNIYIQYDSRLEYITINNYSRFNKAYLTNLAKMYYIDLNNYSYIDPSYLELYDGSEIKYLTLDNHSHIKGSTYLYDASLIKRVQMANYSKIDGTNHLYNGSEIQYMSMLNVSDNTGTSCYGPGFTDFYLEYGSSIHGLDMKWSTFGGLYLGGSKIEGLEIDNNSKVYNIYLESGSSLLNSKFINSYLDGDYVNNDTFGSILLKNSWMENVVLDTVDFPSWNSNYNGISLINDSSIRNMSLKNVCATDRVNAFLYNWDNRDGLVRNIWLDSSYFENISIENCGQTYDEWNGYITDINLTNDSYISGVDAKLAQIDTIRLDSASFINNLKIEQDGLYDLYMGEGSSIYDLDIVQSYGYFYSNSLTYGSDIWKLKVENSRFYNNNLNNSNIKFGYLNLADIDNCDLTDTALQNFSLEGSYIYELYQINTPNSIGFEFKNIELDFYNDSAHTYSLTSAIGHNNTIKHQFTVSLDGLGDGYVNIPRYIVPDSGWYIEKAIVDCTTLVVSGTTSFSLGLHESHPESVLDNVDSTVLSNKVKVYDISNGGVSGSKSTGLDWIGLYIHDETGSSYITTGTMNIEITLKNTNYFTTWWA